MRPASWLADLGLDARHAIRSLRRTPVLTSIALVILACAIGANTAVFSLLDLLVLRDLPVRAPAELVEFLWTYPMDPPLNIFSVRDYENYRDQNRVFSALAGTASARVEARMNGRDAELGVECVTGNYFNMLGVRSAAGRLLVEGDDRSEAPAVGVVSSRYWTEHFNRGPDVLGATVTFNADLSPGRERRLVVDVPVTVIGVAERSFSGLVVGNTPDIWMPASVCARRGPISLALIARLKDGVSIDRAEAEMRVLDRTRIESFALRDPRWRETTFEVVSARSGLSTPVHQQFARPLLALMGMVAAVLLLVCANLGGMLLARGASRRHEMTVRVSLGASRARLMRQLLTESMLLSIAGGLLGTAVAYLEADLLVRIMKSGTRMIGVPPALEATIDARVLIFTAVVIAVSAILFGLVPAWTAFVSEPAVALRDGASAGEPRSRRAFGNGLVVAQVALSLVLLTLSGLFVGHLSNLRGTTTLGFDPTSVLIVRVDASPTGADGNAALQRYKELLARFESIPGVRSATASGTTPISGAAGSRFATVEGFQEAPETRRRLWLNAVAPRYFETLRTPLISGRDFAFSDEGRRVAIVNEAIAQYYFAGRDALGKHVQFDGDAQPYEIIGVVADAKYNDVRTPAPRTIYLHYLPRNRVWDFSLRTIGSAAAIGADVRRLVTDVLGNARVTKMTTLAEQVDASIVPERLIATLSSFFGGVGALLGALGLYGLLAYAVARRTREIGLRVAIGAQPHQVMFIVVSRACALVGVGLVVGIPLAVWTTQAAAAVVGNVPAAGPVPIAIAGLVTIVVAMVASAIPARRAISVDPIAALRSE